MLDVQDVSNMRLFGAIKLLSPEAYKDLLVKAEFNRDRALMQMCIDAKPYRSASRITKVLARVVPKPTRHIG